MATVRVRRTDHISLAAVNSPPRQLGYTDDELRSVPQGVVCRGCANPTAMTDLKAGETILDLGCGAGLDAFLAARKVGPRGKVIGIGASAEAVATAVQHAATGD